MYLNVGKINLVVMMYIWTLSMSVRTASSATIIRVLHRIGMQFMWYPAQGVDPAMPRVISIWGWNGGLYSCIVRTYHANGDLSPQLRKEAHTISGKEALMT